VEFHFNAEEWKRLTPPQRVARCQALAAESHGLAQASKGEFQAMYLDLATQWLKLAEAIGESADG
jgi:hypothetical protein